MFYYSIIDPPENVLLTTNATTNKACQSDVVSFTCSADAVPSAMSFQLFKDNAPMEISASGMWIKTLSEGGMFHYKCVANNSIGSASSTNIKCHCLRKPGRGHGSRSTDSFHLSAVFNLHWDRMNGSILKLHQLLVSEIRPPPLKTSRQQLKIRLI